MGSQISTLFNFENKMSKDDSTNKRTYVTESLIFRMLNVRKENIHFHGDHETHVFDGSEGELYTRNYVCEKNPGHTKFIPVDTFTLEHLPDGKRDNDLYEFIKAVADLTVKINVKMTSPHRPMNWPESNDPYPFYNMRGHEVLRTGSGIMDTVDTFIDGFNQYGGRHRKAHKQCWCRKCEYSDSPSNVWWEFDVYTAAHVIFDDIEASHTTLRMFYNSKDSPVVIVDKVDVVNASIKQDKCKLKCVTCDKHLADKLKDIYKHYDNVRINVQNKYRNYRSVDKLTFIVSHPHGCTKQVSIGHWIKKYKLSKLKRKFTYTTSTCPGSSGATVHCIGCTGWRRRLYDEPVHSGTNSKLKYNYSGIGW